MNPEAAFGDLGIDAVTGTLFLDLLDMSPDEFASPERFSKLRSVIDYLKQFPEDTQRFLVTKATRGKYVDRLDHMFEYTSLLKAKEEKEKALAGLERESSATEHVDDPFLKVDLAKRSIDTREALKEIKEEIAIYER